MHINFDLQSIANISAFTENPIQRQALNASDEITHVPFVFASRLAFKVYRISELHVWCWINGLRNHLDGSNRTLRTGDKQLV